MAARYRKGAAPKVATAVQPQPAAAAASPPGAGAAAAPPPPARTEDDIRRLIQARVEEQAAVAKRRAELLSKLVAKPLQQSETGAPASSSSSSSESGSNDDDDGEAERRAQLRARKLAERGEPPAAAAAAPPAPAPAAAIVKADAARSVDLDAPSSSSTSPEDEESSSEDDIPRPVFVSKQNRTIIKDAETLEREREAAEQAQAAAKARDHDEAVRIARVAIAEEVGIEALKARRANDAVHGVNGSMPDDRDGADEEAEFIAWKKREFARLARELAADSLDVNAHANEATAPTEDEDARARHHRGAFFMSDDRIARAVREREKGEALLKQQGLLASQADKRAAMKHAPESVVVRGSTSAAAASRKPTAGDESEDEDDGDIEYVDPDM